METLFDDLHSDTQQHSQRVSRLSVLLGIKLNLPLSDLKKLLYGGLFHDIGKVKIEKSLLFKHGRLSEAEFAKIKKHTIYGYTLAGKYIKDKNILNVIKNHHERVDGNGYLGGIIPSKLTQIVSLADAYDAMTHQRVYKRTLSKEEAIKELIKFKGTQFNSEYTDKFIECLCDEEEHFL